MSSYEKLTLSLTERLRNVQDRAAHIQTDICAPEDADSTEQAIRDEDDEQLAALDEASLAEVDAIKATLARIEQGTFGICTNCGQAIHGGRLEAMPTASLCIECAEDSDKIHHRL